MFVCLFFLTKKLFHIKSMCCFIEKQKAVFGKCLENVLKDRFRDINKVFISFSDIVLMFQKHFS